MAAVMSSSAIYDLGDLLIKVSQLHLKEITRGSMGIKRCCLTRFLKVKV